MQCLSPALRSLESVINDTWMLHAQDFPNQPLREPGPELDVEPSEF